MNALAPCIEVDDDLHDADTVLETVTVEHVPPVNFHPDREPSARIHAVIIDGVLVPTIQPFNDEMLLLDMLAEWDVWKKEKSIEVPALALCLTHRCLHLAFELAKRICIRRSVSLLTKIGKPKSRTG